MKGLRSALSAVAALAAAVVWAEMEKTMSPVSLGGVSWQAKMPSVAVANDAEYTNAVAVFGTVIRLPVGLKKGKPCENGDIDFYRQIEGDEHAIFYTIRCDDMDAAQYVGWPHGRLLALTSQTIGEFDVDAMLDDESTINRRLRVLNETVWCLPKIVRNEAILCSGFSGQRNGDKNVYTAAWRYEFRVGERRMTLIVQKSTYEFNRLPGMRARLKKEISDWVDLTFADRPSVPSPDSPPAADSAPPSVLPDETAPETGGSDETGVDGGTAVKWIACLAVMLAVWFVQNRKKRKNEQ